MILSKCMHGARSAAVTVTVPVSSAVSLPRQPSMRLSTSSPRAHSQSIHGKHATQMSCTQLAPSGGPLGFGRQPRVSFASSFCARRTAAACHAPTSTVAHGCVRTGKDPEVRPASAFTLLPFYPSRASRVRTDESTVPAAWHRKQHRKQHAPQHQACGT